jgi:hypothetical protein
LKGEKPKYKYPKQSDDDLTVKFKWVNRIRVYLA